ncbi:efflux RND transporter periplasmic adaptor subunit, partial [bacterium]|nr:efflux RND transporter periplasmic adaptor subunit [bacterium]
DLLKIVDISRVKVEAKISPGLLKFVHPDQEVEVTINTVPQTKVKARISSVSKLADSKDQMCHVRTILENKDFAFQPGFTAKIEIATKRGE